MDRYFVDEFEMPSLLKLMISAQAKLCPTARRSERKYWLHYSEYSVHNFNSRNHRIFGKSISALETKHVTNLPLNIQTWIFQQQITFKLGIILGRSFYMMLTDISANWSS